MGEVWEAHGILGDDVIRYSSGWSRVRAALRGARVVQRAIVTSWMLHQRSFAASSWTRTYRTRRAAWPSLHDGRWHVRRLLGFAVAGRRAALLELADTLEAHATLAIASGAAALASRARGQLPPQSSPVSREPDRPSTHGPSKELASSDRSLNEKAGKGQAYERDAERGDRRATPSVCGSGRAGRGGGDGPKSLQVIANSRSRFWQIWAERPSYPSPGVATCRHRCARSSTALEASRNCVALAFLRDWPM